MPLPSHAAEPSASKSSMSNVGKVVSALKAGSSLKSNAGLKGPAVKYNLSVTGTYSNDECMFDKAYDAQRFRSEAALVLQAEGPRVGGKKEGVDAWINIAATKVEVLFRGMVKDILTAGRGHNEREREMLKEWLSERDDHVATMQKERDTAIEELQKARGEVVHQSELMGKSAAEVLEMKAKHSELQEQVDALQAHKDEFDLRERQFVDSLAHCRRQIEERDAEITRLNEYLESKLKERTDTTKQFEQLRADIAEQSATFTISQQAVLDRHAEETKTLNDEVDRLRQQVIDLQESAMQKELVMSTNQAATTAAQAAASVAHSQAKGEWAKMESEFKGRIERMKTVEDENRMLKEWVRNSTVPSSPYCQHTDEQSLLRRSSRSPARSSGPATDSRAAGKPSELVCEEGLFDPCASNEPRSRACEW